MTSQESRGEAAKFGSVEHYVGHMLITIIIVIANSLAEHSLYLVLPTIRDNAHLKQANINKNMCASLPYLEVGRF